MEENKRKWFQKENMGKWLKRDNLLILILSGVLLFIIALPSDTGKTQNTEKPVFQRDKTTRTEAEERGGTNTISDDGFASKEDYCADLEKRLQKLLSGVADVGKVQVMITLKTSEELIVEKDAPINRTNSTEQDAQGGSRISNQMDSAESTVYRTEGGSSEPYVVKTLLPKVEGVVVVAQGAGKGAVNKGITEIVQALLDVEPHKVKVVKMGETG